MVDINLLIATTQTRASRGEGGWIWIRDMSITSILSNDSLYQRFVCRLKARLVAFHFLGIASFHGRGENIEDGEEKQEDE
jgi:hypothetical protein